MNTRVEILKRYIEEDPDDDFLYHALALEYHSSGDSETGHEILSGLLKRNPEYLPAYYMIGAMSEKLGKIDEAISWYGKGCEVAKRQSEFHTLAELKSALSGLTDDDD